MTRLYEAAALAYGLATMAALTVIAMWLGDALALKLMIGVWVSAYGCQVLTAWSTFWPDKKWIKPAGFTAWAASVAFGAAAIWYMVA